VKRWNEVAAVALTAILTLLNVAITAQDTPALSFEAASIRRAEPAARGLSMNISPGGRVTFTNATIRAIIGFAFGIRNVEGGPGWLTTETYEIVATAGRQITPPERNAMLRSLLADRLKLRTHVETRERPAYALTLLRDDGRLGPDIVASTFDCAALATAPRTGGPAPLASNGAPACGFTQSAGVMKSSGASMASIASSLSTPAGREVIDRTGVPGVFDFTLRYSPNVAQPIEDYPSVFTAVREQLGLKLESTTAPAKCLIVDAIERPSEN
jgi:uncharacterized protein (TIGR03435 family)